jgi:hypothetical protein
VIGRVLFHLLATAAIAVSTAACTSGGDADAAGIDRSTGQLADESYQWSADPGFDLLSGPAVPVRAFLESRIDSQTMHNLDYAYPGFDRAVAESEDGNDMLTRNLRPDVSRGSASEAVRIGNNRFRIDSMVRDGDKVTAVVCNYRYGLALEQDNGAFVSVAHDNVGNDGIDALQIRMTAPADESKGALPRQEGPAVAPAVDVFGDWQITGFLSLYGGPDPAYAQAWPNQNADLAKCVEQAPDPPDRRAFLIDGQHPRSDFPTSPPTPGWPEPAK